MTEDGAAQQWTVELSLHGGTGRIPVVAGRPIHGFWSFIAPHFSDVLLAPHRRLDGSAVDFTWTEPAPTRRLEAGDLSTLRRRLAQGVQELTDAAEECPDLEDRVAGQSRRTVMMALAQTMSAVVSTLVNLPDARLATYVARTTAGVRLHSWGSREPGHPQRTDATAASPVRAQREFADPSAPTRRQPARAPARAAGATGGRKIRRRWLGGVSGVVGGAILIAAVGWVVTRNGSTNERPIRSHHASSPNERSFAQGADGVARASEPIKAKPLTQARAGVLSLTPPSGNGAAVSPALVVASDGRRLREQEQEVFASRRAAMALASSGSSLPGAGVVAGPSGSSDGTGNQPAAAGSGGEARGAATPSASAGQSGNGSPAASAARAPSHNESTPAARPSEPDVGPDADAVSPGDPTPAATDKNGRRSPPEPERSDATPSPTAPGASESLAASPVAGAAAAPSDERDQQSETGNDSGAATRTPDDPADSGAATKYSSDADSDRRPLPGPPLPSTAEPAASDAEPAGHSASAEARSNHPSQRTLTTIAADSRAVRAEFRQTPWTVGLAVDSVLPTQPVPTRLGSRVDAVHRETLDTRRAQRPVAFDSVRSRSGIVVTPRGIRPTTPASLEWSESGGSLRALRTTSSAARGKATWEDLLPSLERSLELLDGGGQTLVSIAPLEQGALAVTWTEAVDLSLWLEIGAPDIEPALRERLRWEISLDGRSVTPTHFSSEADFESVAVTVLCPHPIASVSARYVVMLVDPGSGWALRSELSLTPSPMSGE